MTQELKPGPILVTGAAGLLGKAMVDRFQNEYEKVHAFVLTGQERPASWNDRVTVFEGDVTEANTLIPAMEGVHTVFHNVAKIGDWGPAKQFHEVGVVGTENLIGLALPVDARFLLTSSITVNGDQIGNGTREVDQPFGKPMGPYSAAKQKQEELTLGYHRDKGLRATVIRPGNIIGPGSQPWVHTCIEQLRLKRPAVIGSGDVRFGCCYVDNVVEVFALAAENDDAIGKVYYALDDCAEVSWRKYISDLAQIAGTPPPKSVPMSVAKVITVVGESLWRLVGAENRPPLTREALNQVANDMEFSLARSRQDLGYEPIATYEQAMNAIAEYVKREGL